MTTYAFPREMLPLLLLQAMVLTQNNQSLLVIGVEESRNFSSSDALRSDWLTSWHSSASWSTCGYSGVTWLGHLRSELQQSSTCSQYSVSLGSFSYLPYLCLFYSALLKIISIRNLTLQIIAIFNLYFSIVLFSLFHPIQLFSELPEWFASKTVLILSCLYITNDFLKGEEL